MVEQPGDPVVGLLQIGRRQIDALGETAEFVDHHVAMGEIGGGGLRDVVDLAADAGEAVLHAYDDALDLRGTFAGALGPQRGVAALADQAADLAVKIAHGIADRLGGLARRFGEALYLGGNDGKASSRRTGARGLDGGVQRQQVGLLGDRLDRSGDLGDLGQRGSDRTETPFDAADGFDQFGDVLHRRLHRVARLRDVFDGGGRGGLHRARGAGDIVIGGNHGLGGLLQLAEPVGLAGDTAGDFAQIAGDVRKLYAKAADPVRQLVDQTFAVRRCCGGVVRRCGLRNWHQETPLTEHISQGA